MRCCLFRVPAPARQNGLPAHVESEGRFFFRGEEVGTFRLSPKIHRPAARKSISLGLCSFVRNKIPKVDSITLPPTFSRDSNFRRFAKNDKFYKNIAICNSCATRKTCRTRSPVCLFRSNPSRPSQNKISVVLNHSI